MYQYIMLIIELKDIGNYTKERKTQSFVFDMIRKMQFSLNYARIDIFHIPKNIGIVSLKRKTSKKLSGGGIANVKKAV